MLTDIQKEIIELCFLGSYIQETDPFIKFERDYRTRLFSKEWNFETSNEINYSDLENALNTAIVDKVKEKKPIVLLSGGIDSTVIAHTLFKNNIKFESYAFFMSDNDSGIKYVKYLDDKYNVSTKIVIGNYDDLKDAFINYFDYYQSPNIDYACLSMAILTDAIKSNTNLDSKYIVLDGIEGDNLMGYNNNFKLHLKSRIMGLLSNSSSNKRLFKSKKINLYTSSLIDNYEYNSLYQNYIVAKIIDPSYITPYREHLREIIPLPPDSISFHSKNMLAMLYFMGRRVAYKDYLPFTKAGYEVLYPFTTNELLEFGFEIPNKLKIKPIVKYPLKHYLEREGYSKEFVYSHKRGMITDIFRIMDYDDIIDSFHLLKEIVPFRKNGLDYINKLYRNRDGAIDHYLFSLVIASKYVKNYYK